MSSPKVLVIMATYNGAKYVSDQIESILRQQSVSINISIYDDRSSDGTKAICEDFARRFSNISFTRNQENLGPRKNFLNALYSADANSYDYFALSDQDDIWEPSKLAVAVESIERLRHAGNARFVEGYGFPILYCSDLCNVNADLSNPHRELETMRLNMEKRGSLLVRNWFSGCTMVLNADLLKLVQAKRVADSLRMHDIWILSVAYYCGSVVFDRENALIERRITGDNVSGEVRGSDVVSEVSPSHLLSKPRSILRPYAKLFYNCYQDFLDEDDKARITKFIEYGDSLKKRIAISRSEDYEMPTFLGTLIMRIKFLFARY